MNPHTYPPTPPTTLHPPAGGKVQGLTLPTRVFPCASPAEVRSTLPPHQDVLAFQCRNPIHRAHYELFIRALDAPNVKEGAVCLVHPTCGPTQVGTPGGGCTALCVQRRGLLHHFYDGGGGGNGV